RNLAERVAALHFVAIRSGSRFGRFGFGRFGRGRRGCGACFGGGRRRSRRRLRRERRRFDRFLFRGRRRRDGLLRHRWRRRRRLRDGLLAGAVLRWIEKECVFADEAPGTPGELDEDIEERLVHRLRGRDAPERPLVAALEVDAQAVQRGIDVDAGRLEGFGRGEARGQALFFARLQRNDLDFGEERLAKR